MTLTKKSSIEVNSKPFGVCLGTKVRREAGDSEHGPSSEELCSKGMQEERTAVGRENGEVKRKILFFNEKANSMLISPAAIYGAPDCGARYFTCDNAFNPPNGFAM